MGVIAAASACRCSETRAPEGRLSARVVVAEGGAARALDLVDRVTDAACRLEQLEPSTSLQHCLPRGTGVRSYLDAACREAVIWSDDARWARLRSTREVAELGGRHTPERVFRSGEDGACAGPEAPRSPRDAYYVQRRVLSMGSFASGRASRRRLTDRLSQLGSTLDASGARVVNDLLWDETLGGSCALTRDAEGVVCEPSTHQRVYDAALFVDACRTELVVGIPSLANGPAERITSGGAREVLRLAPLDEAARVFVRQPDGVCVPVEVEPKRRQLLLVPRSIAPAQWPRLERKDEGTGRLRVVRAFNGGTEVAAVGRGVLVDDRTSHPTFLDTKLGLECTAAWVDDALRCVPTAPAPAQPKLRYADAACERRAVTWPRYAARRFFAVKVGEHAEDGGHLPIVEVYTAGEATTGYARTDYGDCAPAPEGGPGQAVEHPTYARGERVAGETFAPLRLERRTLSASVTDLGWAPPVDAPTTAP